MIREALEWLVTPSLPFARRSGHLSEFVAIAARRRRHRAAWASHEARSRAAVLRAAAAADPDGTAVILGAGHLYDVPLEELATRFRRVRLVDLAFSTATRRAARRLGNVTCLRRDVTESLPSLAPVAEPRFLLGEPGTRFVASVNLLSQLAVVATRDLDDATADRIGRALVQAHLDWLRRLPCPAALICDRAIEIAGPDGSVIATLDPLKGAAAPEHDETWIWELAPRGEIDRDHAVRHVVGATDDVRRPQRETDAQSCA
ncbi:hypothetical protein GCM10017083_32920 [Thalassobaculum fulvum]|uniref:Uncharacterized protein n=1 Tax=Thalassobaculum fulvum TaxID=1633335 RepID=A0A918XTF7_9PROT|nr:hypothetical protein [Thalassobaculum fulvum]GHD54778.1 hypothetical protein GCM10017083_32920 [Thalassobaculum fulvum]